MLEGVHINIRGWRLTHKVYRHLWTTWTFYSIIHSIHSILASNSSMNHYIHGFICWSKVSICINSFFKWYRGIIMKPKEWLYLDEIETWLVAGFGGASTFAIIVWGVMHLLHILYKVISHWWNLNLWLLARWNYLCLIPNKFNIKNLCWQK